MKGYFGIGIFQPKWQENIGTLWRSAYQLGANFIFIIDGKFKKQHSDTCKTTNQIPCFQFSSYKEFKKTLYDCKPIIIEFSEKSTKLKNFVHPKKCVYLLGNESSGFSKEILDDIDTHIEIESVRQQSYNVAMAGTIVMYDRLLKSL